MRDWIPVSKKLPDKDGYYIVSEKVFDYEDKNHVGEYHLAVETAYINNGAVGRPHNYVITAWMSLPEPYNECDTDGSRYAK